MAEVLTKAEAEELLKTLQAAVASMTHPSHRVCEKCFTLSNAGPRGRDRCYCDYESDRFGE